MQLKSSLLFQPPNKPDLTWKTKARTSRFFLRKIFWISNNYYSYQLFSSLLRTTPLWWPKNWDYKYITSTCIYNCRKRNQPTANQQWKALRFRNLSIMHVFWTTKQKKNLKFTKYSTKICACCRIFYDF